MPRMVLERAASAKTGLPNAGPRLVTDLSTAGKQLFFYCLRFPPEIRGYLLRCYSSDSTGDMESCNRALFFGEHPEKHGFRLEVQVKPGYSRQSLLEHSEPFTSCLALGNEPETAPLNRCRSIVNPIRYTRPRDIAGTECVNLISNSDARKNLNYGKATRQS